jgi:hypothetical protein
MDCVPKVPVIGGREYRLRGPNAASERPARAPIDGSVSGADSIATGRMLPVAALASRLSLI